MSQGPSAGEILAGIFLLLCGLCLTLLGGGCTILWIIFSVHEGTEVDMFLLSIVTLAMGILLIWAAFKLLRSDGKAEPAEEAERPGEP